MGNELPPKALLHVGLFVTDTWRKHAVYPIDMTPRQAVSSRVIGTQILRAMLYCTA